jgi:phosphoglycolate phosphatase
MKVISNLNVLFFDMDGVIIDSRQSVESSLDEVFHSRGIPPLTDEEKNGLIGPPIAEVVAPIIATRGLMAKDVDLVVKEFRKIYNGHLDRTPLFEGIREVIEELSHLNSMAIVTSKPENQALQILEALGLQQYFSPIIGSNPVLSTSKISLLKKAINQLGVTNGMATWMIGDRFHDVEAAKQNQISSAGVLWGYGSETELITAGADLIFKKPSDLLRYFGEKRNCSK